ncbi:glycoside hydrolase family 94 protein [Hyaloscypha hepaticicola]|uniref:Glycoside hydrolase family 94 protein n=1 Tax=Hyaloscypha hepaticicola TaxID=2082293 RepID=A0A2J6QDX6_9HELO|nr:glycoside hydrolase family 94 protein [Hyaloscypha hepaticicola]
MMIQVTCRGYATAQFMQPEPAKYAHAPNIEAKTFMQPEQAYYAHHPGRFVYIKDEESGEIFSAPYEPCRTPVNRFVFSVGKSDIPWTVEHLGIRVELTLSLPTNDVAELWTVKVTNLSGHSRKISVYPYFPIGNLSWMNQSAEYREDLGGVVASSFTPYQRAQDYFKNKSLKDKTFFLWEGGLHAPSALMEPNLLGGDARYEVPIAAVQYRTSLEANDQRVYRFLFGPAVDDLEIRSMRKKYLSEEAFAKSQRDYAWYIEQGRGCLHIETPDKHLDNFVNNWLPRQVYYHGDVNRLTTDPQTRNYLQDNMGMSFIKPEITRKAFLTALSQQEASGNMPDGILLAEGAELKYINQVPHTDHCVWLPVTLEVYLAETGDYALLHEEVKRADGSTNTVFSGFCQAMDWLISARDERGLSYIKEGDWCDPMNMVGYKGKGVSGWLTVATGFALKLWAKICDQQGETKLAAKYRAGVTAVNEAANTHLWDAEWFARGITDDNVVFGTQQDTEGRIWLNPQVWSILSRAASPEQRAKIIPQIEKQLGTPYGVTMFAPPFQKMREDLPVYIPNYYRGAYHEFPRTAGRSSHLFNTGTMPWVYRCLVEGLCGLRGDEHGLRVDPQLPSAWDSINVTRLFRGARFMLDIRHQDVEEVVVKIGGKVVPGAYIKDFEAGKTYQVLSLSRLNLSMDKSLIDGWWI